jgi:hypothetical protein
VCVGLCVVVCGFVDGALCLRVCVGLYACCGGCVCLSASCVCMCTYGRGVANGAISQSTEPSGRSHPHTPIPPPSPLFCFVFGNTVGLVGRVRVALDGVNATLGGSMRRLRRHIDLVQVREGKRERESVRVYVCVCVCVCVYRRIDMVQVRKGEGKRERGCAI